MKRVLIISYFSHPNNLPASHRIEGFLKHLNLYNYFPTLISFNWESNNKFKISSNEVEHYTNNENERFLISYKNNFRDNLLEKKTYFAKFLAKTLTLFELLFQHFNNRFTPLKKLYDFAFNHLENNKFDLIIISGNPFIQFKFGYLLNKRYNTPWIADYRDAWTTQEFYSDNKIYIIFRRFYDKYFEKKYLKSSSAFITVSQYYVQLINKITLTPGYCIYNGFYSEYNIENTHNNERLNTKTFVFLYSGSVFPSQNIEPFIRVYCKLKNEFKNIVQFQFIFVGSASDEIQRKRILKASKNDESIIITNRIPKNELFNDYKKTNIFVHFSYSNFKGIPSSKIYDYFYFKKPILLYPTDNDIIAEMIKKSGLGIIPKDEIQLENAIKDIINSPNKLIPNNEYINSFSQQNQTKLLSEVFDKIIRFL